MSETAFKGSNSTAMGLVNLKEYFQEVISSCLAKFDNITCQLFIKFLLRVVDFISTFAATPADCQKQAIPGLIINPMKFTAALDSKSTLTKAT